LKTINCPNCVLSYKVFVDPPTELKPTEKDIGKFVECAGYKYPNESLKLYTIDKKKDVVTVVSIRGFYACRFNQVVLHREEVKRLNQDRESEVYQEKLMKKIRARRRNK